MIMKEEIEHKLMKSDQGELFFSNGICYDTYYIVNNTYACEKFMKLVGQTE